MFTHNLRNGKTVSKRVGIMARGWSAAHITNREHTRTARAPNNHCDSVHARTFMNAQTQQCNRRRWTSTAAPAAATKNNSIHSLRSVALYSFNFISTRMNYKVFAITLLYIKLCTNKWITHECVMTVLLNRMYFILCSHEHWACMECHT